MFNSYKIIRKGESKMTRLIRGFFLIGSKFGHEYKILGVGVPWLGGNMMIGPGGGQKINLMREFLNSQTFSDEDVILFTDGYDTNVCGSPDEFIQKWKLFDCDVLFGAESYNWPGECKTQPDQNGSRFKYLNSGGYIGKATVIKEMFNANEIQNHADDQYYCQCLFVSKRWNTKLDARKEVFCCLSDFRYSPNNVKNISSNGQQLYFVSETQTYPLQLHGNGDHVIKDIWLKLVK